MINVIIFNTCFFLYLNMAQRDFEKIAGQSK